MTKGLRVLATVGIITIAPALTACAYAQYGNYPRGGYGRVSSPAYDIGYREGIQAGQRDARSNRPRGFERDNDYRRADKGWNWRYGDREAYRYEFRRGYERGYREAYRGNAGYGRVASPAYDIGYREGIQAGQRDARSNRPRGFERDNDYRRADKGWNWRYGDREAYRYEVRRGYERGYREAFSGNSGYGRYGGRDDRYRYPQQYPNGPYGGGRSYPRDGGYYRSPAAQYGFDEGYQKGREDSRDRDAYDPVRQKWYREGDRHYDRNYGSRDQWKNEYREAFKQGYDRGYREGRY